MEMIPFREEIQLNCNEEMQHQFRVTESQRRRRFTSFFLFFFSTVITTELVIHRIWVTVTRLLMNYVISYFLQYGSVFLQMKSFFIVWKFISCIPVDVYT